jgi:hypothetical protein
MKASARVFIALITAAAAFTGCDKELATLDANRIDKIVLTYPKGGMVITDTPTITDLTQAMKSAKVDNTLYDTAMALTLQFYDNDVLMITIAAGGPFFRLGNNQYRSEQFQKSIGALTSRKKNTEQSVPGYPPQGVGSPEP